MIRRILSAVRRCLYSGKQDLSNQESEELRTYVTDEDEDVSDGALLPEEYFPIDEDAKLEAALKRLYETRSRPAASRKPKPSRHWKVSEQLVTWDCVPLTEDMEVPDHAELPATLTPAVAENLAKTQGALYLDQVTAIQPEVAQRLAEHEGELSLDGLTDITPAVAEAFAGHAGGLSLGGLTNLSPETAKALAGHKGDLYLDGLSSLSVELAEILAGCRGGLSLQGVTKLSPAVAEALARHAGELGLGTLESLPIEVAEALATHEGELALGCSGPIARQQAEALARHKNKVNIYVRNISDHAAEAMCFNPQIVCWEEVDLD